MQRSLRLSTAQTLSIATTGVVVAVLATAIIVVWVTLTRSAVRDAQTSVARSVTQLAASTVTSLRAGQIRYARVADDTAIIRALTHPESTTTLAPVRAVLRKLEQTPDSGLPVELWDASGRRVTYVGDDTGSSLRLTPGEEGAISRASLAHMRGLDSLRNVDSLQLSTLERVGDRTLYWTVMPVEVGRRIVGYVAQRRRIAAGPQAEAIIRELSGNSARGFYRNVDGTGWTTFGGAPSAPPDTVRIDRELQHTRAGIGPVIAAEQRIAGTPLMLRMEVPRNVVVAEPNATVRQLALLSVILTVIGAFLAWQIGRRVARPLVDLTEAAELVARGDYTARVPQVGSHEISRLATSFNRMATHIGESRSLLETREAELRSMSDTIPQLAWMADEAGDVLWFNKRWYEYTGLSGDQPLTGAWRDAHDPEDAAELTRRWKASVESGEPLEMEVRLRGRSDEHRWFLTRVEPVRHEDGHVARWFGTSTDIQALRDAREAAQAGNRAKSEFLAAMSHELRTPLNAIGGYAELMELGVRGPITDEQRRDLARIRASQAHLLGLIGSLLDLTRIESGRVTYELVSIAVDPFLMGVEGLVLPQAAAKQQQLVYEPCDGELTVFADREKLRQILLNLLSNAVRYSPPGASITLSASQRDALTVAIEVRDDGPGIPLNRQDAIFEPFVQLDRSLTHSSEGVGLGLAISRDLAHGMGGELSVESAPGEGSRFIVTLPAGVYDERTQMAQTAEMQTRISGGNYRPAAGSARS